jgi:hypothetical protein
LLSKTGSESTALTASATWFSARPPIFIIIL